MRAPRALQALIFDLDGTLVDTDPLHFAVYREVLAEYGIVLEHAFYQAEMSGVPNMALMEKLLPELPQRQQEALVARKEETFRTRAGTLSPLPGLAELFTWADAKGLELALVTSAPKASARMLLAALALQERFAVTVLAEDLPRGKPDPLPYRSALAKLGLNPEDALVFEDAPAGIVSATSAGIFTVGVASTQAPARLKEAGAGLVVADYTDAALWDLLEGSSAP